MFFDNAHLKEGQTVLIQAGGSGIGTAAIQLAKAVGATIITTVSTDEKAAKAKALGADHVINYKEERFEGVVRKLTKKQGVDVVFEHVGPDTFAQSMFCLKRGGTLVTCGSTTGVSAEISLFQLYQRQLRLIGSFGCNLRNLAAVLDKMGAGIARPVIDTVITLDEIDAALARLESRDVFGKIIVTL
jgi:alcohol dehydrogenase